MTENTNPPEGSLDWRLSAYKLSWKFVCWKVTIFHQNSGRAKYGASLCLLSCFFFFFFPPNDQQAWCRLKQTHEATDWLSPVTYCPQHCVSQHYTHKRRVEWDKKEAMIFILITRPATSSSACSPSLLITPAVTAITIPCAMFVFMSA